MTVEKMISEIENVPNVVEAQSALGAAASAENVAARQYEEAADALKKVRKVTSAAVAHHSTEPVDELERLDAIAKLPQLETAALRAERAFIVAQRSREAARDVLNDALGEATQPHLARAIVTFDMKLAEAAKASHVVQEVQYFLHERTNLPFDAFSWAELAPDAANGTFTSRWSMWRGCVREQGFLSS